ncbi:hypothetical protein [Algoriphagus namhaensis]
MMIKSVLILFVVTIATVHPLFGQEKSYYNQTEFGVAFGKNADTWHGEGETRKDFSMITFHGVRLSEHHAVGFSVGFDQYESIEVIPFALGWRGFLGSFSKTQLIGGLDLGGASTLLESKERNEWFESWYKGGILISPSIGVRLPAKNGQTALTMTIAYKRQELGFFQGFFERDNFPRPSQDGRLLPGYSSTFETSYLFHSLVARVGLSF